MIIPAHTPIAQDCCPAPTPLVTNPFAVHVARLSCYMSLIDCANMTEESALQANAGRGLE